MNAGYSRKRSHLRDVTRIVAELPTPIVNELDSWAVPAGLPSRTAALAEILKRGLASVRAEQSRAA